MFEWLDPLKWSSNEIEHVFYQVHYVLYCECREFSPQISCHSPQYCPVKCVPGAPERLTGPHVGHNFPRQRLVEKKFTDWKRAICSSRGLQRWRRVWWKGRHLVDRHDMSCAVPRQSEHGASTHPVADWWRSLRDDWIYDGIRYAIRLQRFHQ